MSAIATTPQMAPPDQSLPPNTSGTPSINSSHSAKSDSDKDKAGKKRRLFGIGKKKDEESTNNRSEMAGGSPAATSLPKPVAMRAVSPQRPIAGDARYPTSPHSAFSALGTSPNRLRSSSPRLHSPASSLIFERNVQENPLPDDVAHAIPSHIQTEDHIPAVLEASSKAITDDHLNPDEVEIVTHAAHQPAVVTVAEATMSDAGALSPHVDDGANGLLLETDDNASTYGAIDTSDVRRLSFISFADVVQAEHVENSRDSVMHMSMSSTTNRSPSPPIRSPSSSHGIAPSPPTSGAPSMKGMDISGYKPPRMPGSPTSHGTGTHSPPLGGGELVVETMRQALRKTNSGDLSGGRSQPMSPVIGDEHHPDHAPFKP